MSEGQTRVVALADAKLRTADPLPDTVSAALAGDQLVRIDAAERLHTDDTVLEIPGADAVFAYDDRHVLVRTTASELLLVPVQPPG